MSDSESRRYKRHRRERLVAWVIALLVIGLLTVGLVFVVGKLKDPVVSAVKGLLGKNETENAAEETIEEEPEDVTAEKPIDEDALNDIFGESLPEEEETETKPETDTDTALDLEAEAIVSEMSLEQKVAQLFFVTPERLTGVDTATAAGEKTRLGLLEHPVGGVILMKKNIVEPAQLLDMTEKLQRFSGEACGLPMFIGVDEEGGRVLRIASNESFVTEKNTETEENTEESQKDGDGAGDASEEAGDSDGRSDETSGSDENSRESSDESSADASEDAEGEGGIAVRVTPAMAEIGATGDTDAAFIAGDHIGEYLKAYGINLDLAPVADLSKPDDENGIGDRSFSTDPEIAAGMVCGFLKGLHREGVLGCVKHYPGHGAVDSDTHDGSAATKKDWAELEESDLIPFRAAIEDGARVIMASHISVPELTRDEIPACLSALMLTDKLRGEMGFNGLIITDALNMKAITTRYDSASAAISALNAGADMLLEPEDFDAAYSGVLEAVADGSISEQRITESVRRIVAAKLYMGELEGREAGSGDSGEEESEEGEDTVETEEEKADAENKDEEKSDAGEGNE